MTNLPLVQTLAAERSAPDPASGAAPPVVEARGIHKSYGATVALREARLLVQPGRTHALVGRNGAGKSTLVSILTGLRAPDQGSVRFNGDPAPPLDQPKAWQARVACVYQHSTIIPDLSVAENLFINAQPNRGGLIDWQGMRRQARDLLDRWGVDVAETSRAGDLTVEKRQLVEIARSLSRGARFVILDEPTAQLDGAEIRRLFHRITELQSRGVTFLFISHHLQEVYEICQDVTVFRDATHIVTADVADLPQTDLIAAMTGVAASSTPDMTVHSVPIPGAVEAQVSGLTSGAFRNISMNLRAGEIVGITGGSASGRTELAEAIAGLSPFRSGQISVRGRALRSGDVPGALALGIGCVPKSRHKEGLVLGQPIAENVAMPVFGKLGKLGFIAPKRRKDLATQTIRNLDIHASGPEQPVSALSGGNQQKVVFGRALADDPTLLVLIDPTAGVDVKSKRALIAQAQDLRARGKSVLISSAEIDDLRACDRVHVLFHGEITATYQSGWNEQDLIASIEGLST